MSEGQPGSPRPDADRASKTVLDPTQNVLDLVDAAIKRQDDLREAEARHLREIMTLRERYQEKLRAAESARIDAIRAVDTAAVQRAAEVQEVRAGTMATQVVATADAFRAALAAALEPITKDIADLRRNQYEQAGQRAQVVESGTSGRNWIGIAVAATGVLLAALIGIAAIVVTLLLRG